MENDKMPKVWFSQNQPHILGAGMRMRAAGVAEGVMLMLDDYDIETGDKTIERVVKAKLHERFPRYYFDCLVNDVGNLVIDGRLKNPDEPDDTFENDLVNDGVSGGIENET